MNCEVKLIDTMYSCKCRIAQKNIGNVVCDGTPVAKSPWGTELQACKMIIADDMIQSVQSIKSSGGLISAGVMSKYCHTFMDSETNLVIPALTIGKKPYQKGLGYYYTTTWMDDAPKWAFPMYSVGENLLALCKGHLKESHLSCDCTILGKDKNPIMVCPSRNSVPLSRPLQRRQPLHCELHLSLDEPSILAFKTKEERLSGRVALNDMGWPCWATSLVDPAADISIPSMVNEEPSKEALSGDFDIAGTLLELADKGRTHSSTEVPTLTPMIEDIPTSSTATGERKSTAQIKQRSLAKHQRQARSDMLKEAAAAGLDINLPVPILKRQMGDLKWESDLMKQVELLKPEERTEFLDRQRIERRKYLKKRDRNTRNYKKWDAENSSKSLADGVTSFGEVDMTSPGTREPLHEVEELTRPASLTGSRVPSADVDDWIDTFLKEFASEHVGTVGIKSKKGHATEPMHDVEGLHQDEPFSDPVRRHSSVDSLGESLSKAFDPSHL